MTCIRIHSLRKRKKCEQAQRTKHAGDNWLRVSLLRLNSWHLQSLRKEMERTVTKMQCRSTGSPPIGLTPSRISASRLMLFTRKMLMSFSQQKAWINVKWIWRATSWTSSSSVARRHKTTLSGSLREAKGHAYEHETDRVWMHSGKGCEYS